MNVFGRGVVDQLGLMQCGRIRRLSGLCGKAHAGKGIDAKQAPANSMITGGPQQPCPTVGGGSAYATLMLHLQK